MSKLLSHPWLSAPVGIVIYLVATVLFWQKPVLPTMESGVKVPALVPSWAFNNPEVDELITELKAEKQTLTTREKDLNELETRLQAERAELGQVTKSVRLLQNDFDKSVVRVKDEEVANLRKLAKTYALMTPEGAANVLTQLDNEAVVRIFIFLKEKEVAPILEVMAKKSPEQSKRAAIITEELRLSSHNIANTK